jgi:uncharacterized membrane protein HdeD (DUF308 family)
MKKLGHALVFIILGLIVLAFPLLGVITASALSGFAVLALGIGLLIAGIGEMDESKTVGILDLILGFLALILGLGFIFNPALFSWVVGFLVLIAGLCLIIPGIVIVITKKGDIRWLGVAALVLGILYLIFGLYVSNPVILGVLIGLWLLINGVMLLLKKTE